MIRRIAIAGIAGMAVALAGCGSPSELAAWQNGPGGEAARTVTFDSGRLPHDGSAVRSVRQVRAEGNSLYTAAVTASSLPPPADAITYEQAMVHYAAAGAFFAEGDVGAGIVDKTTAGGLLARVTRDLGPAPHAGAASLTALQISHCQSTNLRVGLTHPTAAAGTTYYRLTFRNEGTSPCTFYGYPGVSAAPSPAGPRIGNPAVRNAAWPSLAVVLKPHQRAYAVLGIVSAGNWRPSVCHPTGAAGVRVYPPGAYSAVFVAQPFEACASSRVHALSVTPVRS